MYGFILLGLLLSLGSHDPKTGESFDVPSLHTTPPPSIHQLEYRYHQHVRVPVPERFQRPRDLQPRPRLLYRTVYGFLPYWRLDSYTLIHWDLLTHVACFGVELSATGQVANAHGWPGAWAPVVDSAHAHGVEAHLVIIVFDADAIHSILTTYRDPAIQTILQQVEAGNADGVNIDFEFPYSSDRELVNEFMTLLADSLHARGKHLTIDVPAINWSNRYDPLTLATVTDGLFIMGYDFHWPGSDEAGPVAPLTGWTYNVTGSVQYWVTNSGNQREKIILGVPYYGYKWPTVGPNPHSSTVGNGSAVLYTAAIAEAQTYGLLWDNESQTPWYRYQAGGQWYQCWFDNDSSLGLKYDLVNAQDIQGTGMWALTYDGTRPELWEELASHFAEGTPPAQPTALRVYLSGPYRLTVQWAPVANASGYDVYESEDGESFSLVAHVYSSAFNTGVLPESTVRFYKVRATNAYGTSPFTEVGGAMVMASPNPVLVVNGFDRTQGTQNTFDYVVEHGLALQRLGIGFNSTSNDFVEDSTVDLTQYTAVDWISGEEGTATLAFSHAEQAALQAYLEQGGRLFVSGSEIGYDLWEHGDAQDQAFYSQYLKAQYLGDDANTHQVQGRPGGIFSDLGPFAFDDGTHGYYDVDYPDGVGPTGGSISCLQYVGGTGWSAGIQYTGPFGASSDTGQVVYLGFPVETVYEDSVRLEIFRRVFYYFGFTTSVAERETDHQTVGQLRFLPQELRVIVEGPGRWTLHLWDATGRLRRQAAGWQRVSLNLQGLPSGVYWAEARGRRDRYVQKVWILHR